MKLFQKNPFGHYLFLKKMLIRYLGFLTHRRYRGFNELKIEGSDVIKNLPENNVSNAGLIARGFEPISSFVPIFTVSGRSVLSRKVIHGIPITVVSSVMPPESVITAFAFSTR